MNENQSDPLPGPLIRLGEIPQLPWLPRRNGKPPSISTIHRWTTVGLRGHRLRTIRAGGALATTERWLVDFFGSLSGDAPQAEPARTPVQRARARARAAAELADAGI